MRNLGLFLTVYVLAPVLAWGLVYLFLTYVLLPFLTF